MYRPDFSMENKKNGKTYAMITIDLLSVMTPSFKIWKMWINFYTKFGNTYFCNKVIVKSLFSILKGINHMSF